MTHPLRSVEARVLTALAAEAKPWAIDELAQSLGLDQSPVSAAAAALAERGLAEIREIVVKEYRVGPKASAWPQAEFPERRVARGLAIHGGRARLQELPHQVGMDAREVGESLRWLQERGWARKDAAEVILLDPWRDGEPALDVDERWLAALRVVGPLWQNEPADNREWEQALKRLAKRSGVVEVRERRRRLASVTPAGRRAVDEGLEARAEVNELTTELLVTGRWREVDFRPYDVTLPGPRISAGKTHPMRRILEATRRVFLELGFEETTSPWIESAFWDFDALFQPQDHPARDMQDTFYLERPARCSLPDPALVDRVRRTHEDGGDTGSLGWLSPWSEALAARCVLRTHTTAATVRALAENPRPPRKVFSVGPVFRREAIDFKHLPVFHQVDGIVIDEGASFAALLSLLATFYRKMGFERVQFRPAFFPYTEPSVEAFVWMDARSDWFEMGGAGVFRPEVTAPLGCEVPVLAWGLGLERVAMFRFGLDDIRELYLAHLDWLEETPLCRS